MEATSVLIQDGLIQHSDHILISIKLRIHKDASRILPQKIKIFVTAKDLRNFVKGNEDIAKLLLKPNSLVEPLTGKIERIVPKRRKNN